MNTNKVRNSKYFKVANLDVRVNGTYYNLDNCEFRTIISLQGYCDENGIIVKLDGQGYSLKELTTMVNINFRTLKKTLFDLESKGLIKMSDNGIIRIIGFIEKQSQFSTPITQIIEHKKQNTQSTKSVIEGLTRAVNETNGNLKSLKSKIKFIPSQTNDDEIVDTTTGECYKITKV